AHGQGRACGAERMIANSLAFSFAHPSVDPQWSETCASQLVLPSHAHTQGLQVECCGAEPQPMSEINAESHIELLGVVLEASRNGSPGGNLDGCEGTIEHIARRREDMRSIT